MFILIILLFIAMFALKLWKYSKTIIAFIEI